MDYVVGGVAALVSGNVTPNRPKLIRKALTPTKHQPSPNVTPKSDLQVDRSIFLSPTLQKKKAIVKKSPKRIFQNPELDTTENEAGSSPKADKVKKHLKDDLEADIMGKSNKKSPKKVQNSSLDSSANLDTSKTEDSVVISESSPKKKKKRNSESSIHHPSDISNVNRTIDIPDKQKSPTKSPKNKNNKKTVDITESSEQNIQSTKSDDFTENTKEVTNKNQDNKKKKNKKQKNKNSETNNVDNKENKTEIKETEAPPIKKKKNKKNKNKQQNQVADENEPKNTETEINTTETIKKSKKKNKKQFQTEINDKETAPMEIDNDIEEGVNPNAITEQDSDSEHESDDEIHSENEEANKEVLESQENNEDSDESDNEDDEKETKKKKLTKKEQKTLKEKKKKGDGETVEVKEKEINLEDEVKKTIFVGNVPLSKKTRKEIKKIFRKYGEIKTVRIRFVPVKDARVTPKMAVIKNELHPERSTVNVYVKFADESSVEQALAENNTVLNGYHLRVTRTTTTGAEHDPRLAVFVGNMPFGMEDDQLRAVFDKCGEIESVRIIRDKKTNAGKGFGYVNFTSKDGVELALNLSEEELTVKNRIMRVKRSTQVLGQKGPRPNKPGQNRPPQNRPGQNRPPQNRPGPNRPPQNRPGQNRPWQDRSGQNEAVQDRGEDGAHRRIMNKRKYQESNEGPPNKKPKNINQPNRENKKQRKEFVGMTSEKKKKHKFDKGQKKKKVLSEILTKKRS